MKIYEHLHAQTCSDDTMMNRGDGMRPTKDNFKYNTLLIAYPILSTGFMPALHAAIMVVSISSFSH